ncbi:MAG: DUF3536 domain-containing protein [Flexilinea sp.]
MKKQAFCVHGHFYQPPRENPFTGLIPQEPGASPFNNWNEKILEQCYRPNAVEGNFGRISFDIGPTLATWMEKSNPDVMNMIVQQERSVYEKFGVSNGMAQSYNHTILPLSTREDKVTQVKWGIADFESRFGHEPPGMWAPETAVDTETLSVFAECGVQFTILAPWQAKTNTDLDVSKPYWVDLPGEKRIAVFFYGAGVSSKVSFSPETTMNADGFIFNELLPFFPENSRRERYYLIASDGELYGHHQPLRDKFLEWLTTGALVNSNLENVFPAVWLQRFPPEKSIKIQEKTSWSCYHGVKRWATECPCAEHGEWKAPLRRAFNRIAEIVDTEMQEVLRSYGWDLLAFRNEYASVLTHWETPEELLERLMEKKLEAAEESRLVKLMQAQYERQRMFTSCGWFFGDFDRLEAQNDISYAARAIDLLEQATGEEFRKQVGKYLSKAESWNSGLKASTVFNNMFKGK